MPGRDLHRAYTRYVLAQLGYDYDGDEVHALLDRTAHTHGPSHRNDPAHTMPNLVQQLVLRGDLSPQALVAGMSHRALDRAWSEGWRCIPLPSKMKEPLKQLVSAPLADHFEREARRLLRARY